MSTPLHAEHQSALPTTWQARWIWADAPVREISQFAYFRGTFDVAAASAATLYCTADSRYRIWVNGEYVGFGPARSLPDHPYVDARSIQLRQGTNVIAVLVEHFTEKTPLKTSIFAAVAAGFVCQVEVDGHPVCWTGKSWKAKDAVAYSPLPGTMFPEAFDARLDPEGWNEPAFDDGAWPAAVELADTRLAPPEAFVPRPIPLLTEKRILPTRLLDLGMCVDDACPDLREQTDIAESLATCRLLPLREGICQPALTPQEAWDDRPVTVQLAGNEAVYFVLDFGAETQASPEVVLSGPAGILVDQGYSECLSTNRVPTRWQNMRQSERTILRDGTTRHWIHMLRGFRYMILRIANPADVPATVTLQELCAYESMYPTKPLGSFQSSDPLLEQIFKLSARTVNLCMEDAYVDCPWRERSQWLGDTQPESLFTYYAFGDYALPRKMVREFIGSVTEEGWIPRIAPASFYRNLPTWGMRFPVVLWEYYLYTGDRETFALGYSAIMSQMRWLAGYENDRGLLEDLPEWKFVDWTRLDDRYNEGVVQGWYLEALDISRKIAAELGDDATAEAFAQKADLLRKTLADVYWSPARKAFLKYQAGSTIRPKDAAPDIIGQHENFLFTYLGVGTAEQQTQALQAIAGVTGRYLPNIGDYQSCLSPWVGGVYASEDMIRIGSPFWSFYALLSLCAAGKIPEAVEYIRFCWGMMLEFGATSCWEMWDRHTSLCHGWSAAPAMILPAFVLGVQPVDPGFTLFEIRPQPVDLQWVNGNVPTPHGIITVSLRRETGRVQLQVRVPDGTCGRLDLGALGAVQTLTIDGAACALGAVMLQPGEHVVTAELR